MKMVFNIIGWFGTFFIVLAYLLVSFGLTSPSSISYQLLNLVGALGVILSSYFKKDFQPVILNIFWALIALFGLISIFV